jgi:aminopeptidase N
MANPLHFNAADGSGYAFIADKIIELDAINPQIAARIANSLSR